MNVEAELKKLFEKRSWRGRVLGVQPRIRLCRSFDEQSHSYLGYTLLLKGIVDGVERDFTVGIGKAAQLKHEFCAGEEISGQSYPVPVPKLESVEYYRTSGLRKQTHGVRKESDDGPPWLKVAPALEDYRRRGHRRLEKRTARRASGVAACRWKSSSITGSLTSAVIGMKRSVTDQRVVRCTDRVRSEKSRDGTA